MQSPCLRILGYKDIEEWSFDSEELTEDQIRLKINGLDSSTLQG